MLFKISLFCSEKDSSRRQNSPLLILDTCKQAPWHTVKTRMTCRMMRNFIRVCTVCKVKNKLQGQKSNKILESPISDPLKYKMDYCILTGLNIFIHNSIYIVIYKYTIYNTIMMGFRKKYIDSYESVSLLIVSICKGYSIRMKILKPVHEISNNGVCATSKASDRPAHTQSDQSLS